MRTTTAAGRPRLGAKRRPGGSAREEILDAAAELFTTRGYASTSTRSIADAVGMRQASLYYHFKTKDDILCALLRQTVSPTIEFAERSADGADNAVERLHALATFDGRQLLDARWNLGALYLMPELRQAGLSEFWTERERLRLVYHALSGQVMAGAPGLHPASPGAADLPFRLVESLVNIRAAQPEPQCETLLGDIADACVRVLGVPGARIAGLRDRTAAILAGHDRRHPSAPADR